MRAESVILHGFGLSRRLAPHNDIKRMTIKYYYRNDKTDEEVSPNITKKLGKKGQWQFVPSSILHD